MSRHCEKWLALSLACGFLVFFSICSCEKENLIEPPEFFDAANPEMWPVCLICGTYAAPHEAPVPPPGGDEGICTGANPTSVPLCIEYTITIECDVTLSIFSVQGEEVVTLVRKIQSAGTYSLYWNLNDWQGARVPAGTYRAYFKAGDLMTYGDIVVKNP
jgi:hypothetical protein